MARISRQCYGRGFFHVMVQGIKKEKIFNNNLLKESYLKFLVEGCEKNNVKLIAYCVMDNHCHLLCYTEETENLSKIMASANTKFGMLYNKINERCGYVFRDRYRCENVYSQNYLESCIRYIHNNPVKAGICNEEKEYKYSSYNLYVNEKISDEIIQLVYKGKDYIKLITNKIIEGEFIDCENEFGENPRNEKPEKILKEFGQVDFTNKENMAKLIHNLLKRCNLNKTEVAKLLKIDHRKISRILKSIG